MCGIIGLYNANPKSHVNQALVDGLTVLQHRGQDAAGIVTIANNRLNLRKDNGTVAEVFTQSNMVCSKKHAWQLSMLIVIVINLLCGAVICLKENLRGNIGIGHVRYPTAGGSKSAEAQPLYTNFPFGIAIAHNGNLTNTEKLTKRLKTVTSLSSPLVFHISSLHIFMY